MHTPKRFNEDNPTRMALSRRYVEARESLVSMRRRFIQVPEQNTAERERIRGFIERWKDRLNERVAAINTFDAYEWKKEKARRDALAEGQL